VVFGTLTDRDRTTRWLPTDMVAESHSSQRLRVRAPGGVTEYEVSTVPADLTLSWRSVDSPDLHGTPQVLDVPASGSELRVEVSTPDDGPEPDLVRAFLRETMRHLDRDVSDNFTAG
jgi:hypothetical protein